MAAGSLPSADSSMADKPSKWSDQSRGGDGSGVCVRQRRVALGPRKSVCSAQQNTNPHSETLTLATNEPRWDTGNSKRRRSTVNMIQCKPIKNTEDLRVCEGVTPCTVELLSTTQSLTSTVTFGSPEILIKMPMSSNFYLIVWSWVHLENWGA